MIQFDTFYSALKEHGLEKYSDFFKSQIERQFSSDRHKELQIWSDALHQLPDVKTNNIDLCHSVSIGKASELTDEQRKILNDSLKALIPWRKGPFNLFDTHINTEWRSDWKWERVRPHLGSLKNKRVLDVGCGSGYHCWRMLGEGARWALGIDPSPRFVIQFEMIKHFLGTADADVIPLGIEHLPEKLNFFDTVFSMGVLYHRSSPIDHLKELRDTLKQGGELVLETLVIEGKKGEVLVPDDRYAQMRNVWFIPSVPSLLQWIERCGFEDARCVDLNQTSLEEQRSTEWMPSHSLKEFLNPNNTNQTIEGYPAPLRAVIIAKRKGGKK